MSDSGDSDESSSSEVEYSSDESSEEETQYLSNEQQQLLEKKKQLKQQTSELLLKLTKCLRLCKRKVDTLSPKVFRPNLGQLRGAVDTALDTAERVKCTSTSSMMTLQRMILRASTISNRMYINDNVVCASSGYCLVRVRNILKLTARVAGVIHAYSVKIASVDCELQANKSKPSTQSSGGSTKMENGCDMEASQLDKDNYTEDTQIVEDLDKTCKSLTDKPHARRTHLSGKFRYATGEQSSRPSQLAISKEARKAAFDRSRNNRIDAMIKKRNLLWDSDSESDDSDEYSADSESEDESSDDYSGFSSDDSSDDNQQEVTEQRRLMEMKKKQHQQISTFLVQLTKCLSTCKKEVYTLSPRLVQPGINKLRDAVDNALYLTERIKTVSISSTASLKTKTQTAATIAHVVHIPDSMHSATTRAAYHKLLRVRRFLNLAMRVAALLNACTVNKFSGENIPKATKMKGNMDNCCSRTNNVENQHNVKEVPRFAQKAAVSSGEGSSSVKASKNTMSCDESNSNEKPLKLVVSIKIPISSMKNCKNTPNSTLPAKHPLLSNLKASECCHEPVLNDVMDAGVVMLKKSPRPSNYNPEVGEMINDLLWKVRREVVKKQRAESGLRSVEKKSVFKSCCKKSRFSPYAGRSTLKEVVQHNSETCKLSKPESHSQRNTDAELSTTYLSKTFKKPVLLKGTASQLKSVNHVCSRDIMPPTQSVATETSFCGPSNVSKEQKCDISQKVQHKQRYESEISMDHLADTFGSKCKISESVNRNYSNISFKDPREYEHTSAVVPREKYPGVALQDGGVKFVLRESPLTQVLQHRKLEGKSLNVLSQSMLNPPQSDKKGGKGTLSLKLFTSERCPVTPATAKPHEKEVDKQSEHTQQSLTNSEEMPLKAVTSVQNGSCETVTNATTVARTNALDSGSKQMVFKSSYKNRFSPYPCQSVSIKASKHHVSSTKSKQVKCGTSNPQGKTDAESSIVADASSTKTRQKIVMSLPKGKSKPAHFSDMPSATTVAAETSFTNFSIKPKVLKPTLPQSTAQREQRLKQEISMDDLVDMFGSNCKISESVNRNYSNISFKDPHGYEHTSAVVPREKYPGVALQDGGVKFVLRESPLTQVLQQRKLEGRSLNVLSQSMLNPLQLDQKISNDGVNQRDEVKPLTSCSISPVTTNKGNPLLTSDVKDPIVAPINKPGSRATLKPTKRRLRSKLSNVLAARINSQCEQNTEYEIDEYRRIVGANVSMSHTKQQSQRMRLGKRNATEAGLPVPTGK